MYLTKETAAILVYQNSLRAKELNFHANISFPLSKSIWPLIMWVKTLCWALKPIFNFWSIDSTPFSRANATNAFGSQQELCKQLFERGHYAWWMHISSKLYRILTTGKPETTKSRECWLGYSSNNETSQHVRYQQKNYYLSQKWKETVTYESKFPH